MFVKHISGSFTLLKDNALGFNFPTQNLTPLAGFIVCDMSSRVSYWWVIWGELQGYGDPIHGQGTRESWRETFSKPSPPLPLTPSSWCIQPKGERHRLHCDLQPLNCSCTPYASAHLQLGSHSCYFNFRFQVLLLFENIELTLGLNIFRRPANCQSTVIWRIEK